MSTARGLLTASPSGTAIRREKSLKRWPRPWKFALIERDNPQWGDLWSSLSR
jgi:predicted GIY-YIG superfamily endonuclease